MDKEFIEAEKAGVYKIQNLFDEYFNKFKGDYKKMAELSKIIDERINYNLSNEKISSMYLNLASKIVGRSQETLDSEYYDDFCKLSNNESIVKVDIG